MADSIVALVAIVMVFGIPMSAIVGSFWLKGKRLQAASGETSGTTSRVAKLEAANAELRQRVEVLETIVTSDAMPARPRILVEPAPKLGAEQAQAELESEATAATAVRANRLS